MTGYHLKNCSSSGNFCVDARQVCQHNSSKNVRIGFIHIILRNPFSVEKMTLESPTDMVIYRSRLNAKTGGRLETGGGRL